MLACKALDVSPEIPEGLPICWGGNLRTIWAPKLHALLERDATAGCETNSSTVIRQFFSPGCIRIGVRQHNCRRSVAKFDFSQELVHPIFNNCLRDLVAGKWGVEPHMAVPVLVKAIGFLSIVRRSLDDLLRRIVGCRITIDGAENLAGTLDIFLRSVPMIFASALVRWLPSAVSMAARYATPSNRLRYLSGVSRSFPSLDTRGCFIPVRRSASATDK